MRAVVVLPAVIGRVAAALALAAAASYGLHSAGPMASAVALYVLLTLFFLVVVSVLLMIPAVRRFDRRMAGRMPRGRRFPPGFPPGGGDESGGGSGVREPRRPHPPTHPPRAVALEPEAEGGGL